MGVDAGDASVSALFFDAMCELMEGRAGDALVGAFLAGLTVERCTPSILSACARALRDHAVPVLLPVELGPTMDIVGTGGDGADSFNVSTASALVVAACGVRVVKHGNRSSSSKCGSADLIEATGAALSLTPAQVLSVVQRSGFAFLFAQTFHPAMRHVGAARRAVGVRTVFNLLGPLSNPAIPTYQLTGVYSRQLGSLFALSLHRLGVRRAMVVHGLDEGMDELSPQGPTRLWRVDERGQVEQVDVTPDDFGLPRHPLAAVSSGSASDNCATLLRLLRGEPGPVSDWVVMNASAALVCAGRAEGWKEGAAMAREAIAQGRALRVLQDYVQASAEAVAAAKPSILDTIAAHRRGVVEAAKLHLPLDALLHSALWKSTPPKLSLVLERLRRSGPMALMAEIKRASPSLGDIDAHIDPAAQALAYAKGGAAVISVLTEPRWFKGSLADLRAVRAALEPLPHRPCVLLKDFVVDEYQLVEARIAGADTALLIVAILPPAQLQWLMKVSRQLGMEPLVEVANAREMAIALQTGARLVGVNNRDLHTFTVNADTTTQLSSMISTGERNSPEDFKVLLCALSGIKSRGDVERYGAAGCEAVLVGETLMRASNPSATIRELLGHPPSPSLSSSSAPPAPSSPSLSSTSFSSSSSSSSSASSPSPSLLAPSAVRRHRSGSLTSLRPVVITPPPASPAPPHSTSPSSATLTSSSSSSVFLSSVHPPSHVAAPLPPSNPTFSPLSTLSAATPQLLAQLQQPTITLPLTLPPLPPAQSEERKAGASAASPAAARPPPLVKVCGVVSVQSALLALEAGADLLGLIFVPTSKRCVGHSHPLDTPSTPHPGSYCRPLPLLLCPAAASPAALPYMSLSVCLCVSVSVCWWPLQVTVPTARAIVAALRAEAGRWVVASAGAGGQAMAAATTTPSALTRLSSHEGEETKVAFASSSSSSAAEHLHQQAAAIRLLAQRVHPTDHITPLITQHEAAATLLYHARQPLSPAYLLRGLPLPHPCDLVLCVVSGVRVCGVRVCDMV